MISVTIVEDTHGNLKETWTCYHVRNQMPHGTGTHPATDQNQNKIRVEFPPLNAPGRKQVSRISRNSAGFCLRIHQRRTRTIPPIIITMPGNSCNHQERDTGGRYRYRCCRNGRRFSRHRRHSPGTLNNRVGRPGGGHGRHSRGNRCYCRSGRCYHGRTRSASRGLHRYGKVRESRCNCIEIIVSSVLVIKGGR